MSICGATDIPVLDFWWCLLWVSKPELSALFPLWLNHAWYTFSEILWENFFLIQTENFDEDNKTNAVEETARIFGTEHPWFWRIHITALCSLSEYVTCLAYFYIFTFTFLQASFCQHLGEQESALGGRVCLRGKGSAWGSAYLGRPPKYIYRQTVPPTHKGFRITQGRQTPRKAEASPRKEDNQGIWSMSGWYSSYWHVLLFFYCLHFDLIVFMEEAHRDVTEKLYYDVIPPMDHYIMTSLFL